MAEYLIKNKSSLSSFLAELNIHLELGNVHKTDEFFHIIEKREDKDVIKKILVKHILTKIILKHIKIPEHQIKDTNTQPYVNQLVSISWKENLKFPAISMTSRSMTLLTLLCLLYCTLVVAFFLNYPLVFFTFFLVKLNFIIFLIPIGLLIGVFPRFFF